jgi:cytochrome c oxidase assembly protein subunit 11
MRHTNLSLKLVAMTAAMFAFGYVLVPIYNVFCDVTGLNGRTDATAATVVETPDVDRSVRFEFIASVDPKAPFEFEPAQSSMSLTPGVIYEASYLAKNRTDREIVTQSVPSVAPGIAADYLKKIECFCFTEQRFGPGEEREMGVTFLVEPDLPGSIDTMTLSYTLFALEN